MVTAGAGFVTVSPEEFDAYRLHPDDILFNRTNSIELVGRVAFNELDEDVVFASYLIRLTADRDAVLPRYLFEYLASRPGQRRIRRFISRGVSQANINATNLKSIAMPATTLDAQRDFVARVEEFGALNAALVDRQRASVALMATLTERELGSSV
jgi:restriction endonuclease S subunit